MIDEQSSASGQDYASYRSAIGDAEIEWAGREETSIHQGQFP